MKKNESKKIVLDMDDTLAHFNKEKNALERFDKESNFFYHLKPSKLLNLINYMIDNNYIDINNVYIVSASPNEQADKDKLKWLYRHIPNINKENILFTRLGQNKGTIFIDTYKIKDLSKYTLIDDYTKNLIEWQKLGGKVIKYINEYNNTKQSYKAYNIPTLDLNNTIM